MAKYKGIVTTVAGLEMLAAACSGGNIEFTSVKTGSGVYDGTENLSGMTELKCVQQSFGVSGITRTGTKVKVRSVLSNEGLATGYKITEVGLFAKNAASSEVLYAIIVAETGAEDYLPPYEDSPSNITMEMYFTLTETENDVVFIAEVVEGTYASAEDLQDHVLSEGHIASAERTKWNAASEHAQQESGNPHGVTKQDVGLGNAGNYKAVSTEAQTLTDAEKEQARANIGAGTSSVVLGETSSTAYRGDRGKTAYEHAQKASGNPHSVTKQDVNLGNVPNVSTNDQTPTYTVASANTELVSGEKLSVAFSKIAKAIKSLIPHLADTAIHISSSERSAWNRKANASHGNHVPPTETANNAKFLRNDNTWAIVTANNIGALSKNGGTTSGSITAGAVNSNAPYSMIGTECSFCGGTVTISAGGPLVATYGIKITTQNGTTPTTIDGNKIIHTGNIASYAPLYETGTCSFRYSGSIIMKGVYRKIGTFVFVSAQGSLLSVEIPAWTSITGNPYPVLNTESLGNSVVFARLQLSADKYNGEEIAIADVKGSSFMTAKAIPSGQGRTMYLTMMYLTS